MDVEGLKRLIVPIGDGDYLSRYLPSVNGGDSCSGGGVCNVPKHMTVESVQYLSYGVLVCSSGKEDQSYCLGGAVSATAKS